MNKLKKLAAGAAALAVSAGAALADAPTVTTVTGLVDNGTTVFDAVATLTVAAVGFAILIKMVRKIKG